MTEPTIPRSGRIEPIENHDTKFYWDGLRRRSVVVQGCSDCGETRFPPDPACPNCQSFEWREEELSGEGVICTWTVLHHPLAPGFDGPALAVVVELEAGIRMIGNMDVDPATLRIGERVHADFIHQESGWTALSFRRDNDPRRAQGAEHG